MATGITSHRPAMAWLADLQKAKIEGITGSKPKVTIQDLLERINDPNAPEQALIPSSPRSVEACFRMGVDPVDLQYHPPAWYKRKEDADQEVSNLRYERNEFVRQERLRALIDTRKQLVDEGWNPPVETIRPGTSCSPMRSTSPLRRDDSTKTAITSTMVEKERQRLEVLRRRQERDLQQMVQHEQTRKELLDKQQKKVEELERRAAELARQRQQNEIARMTKQREIELQRAQEDKDNERKARILAEERYQHERKMQAEKAEMEMQMKKKAFQEEMERRRKTEEARKETEAILAAQAEEVRLRKLEMEKRDTERIKRIAAEAKQRHAANQEKRKQADARIAAALEQNGEIMRRKRSAYEQREAEAETRRKELDQIHAREEARKRDDEIMRERERQDKYSAAYAAEEARKHSIQSRAKEKEEMLANLYAQRKKEHDLKKVDMEFQLKLRLDKVDSIQKSQVYQRQRLLEKIMGDYDKTRGLMRERQELQEQRKHSNIQAAMQRAAVAKAMDSLRFSQDVSKINVNDLINRTRPSTAF